MPRKTSGVSRRAWNLLRLALLWARKGGAFKLQLRLVPKFLKTIGQATPRSQIWYRERELSFDKTPVVHVKMHRPGSMRFPLPHIPCINPRVDFDPEFEEDDRLCYGYEAVRQSFLENGGEEGTHFDEEQAKDGRVEIEEGSHFDEGQEEDGRVEFEEGTHFDEGQEEDGRVEIEEDRGIDTRAEEFIAKFYKQMKLQRQISYLQYNEMLNQSAS